MFAQKVWDGGGDGLNWSSANNWNPNGIPANTDDVTIPNGITTTITVNTAAVCKSFTMNGGGTANTVTISGTNSLTVGGAVLINAGSGNNANKILNVAGGSLSCTTITMAQTSAANRNSRLTISTGTVTASGSVDLNSGNTNNTITFSGAGLLKVGGDMSGGSFTSFTNCTVDYYNLGNQSIGPYSYSNLIISGSGTKTLAGASTVTAALTVKASTVLALSTFALGSPTSVALESGAVAGSGITGSGNFTLGGNVTTTNLGTGTSGATISCPITLGGNRTFTVADDGTSAVDLTISGSVSGAFSVTKAGAGTMNLSGANTYSGATTVSTGILQLGSTTALGTTSSTTVSSGASLDLNGFTLSTARPLTLNGTGISSGGALTNSSASAATYSGLITLGSASSIIANSGSIAISNAGTISGATFGLTLGGSGNGSVTSIIGNTTGGVAKSGLGTWTLSGVNTYTGATSVNSGTLSLGASEVLNGDLSIASGASFVTNNNALTFGGNFTNSGTFTAGSSAITISGTANQNIAGFTTTGALSVTKTAGVATFTSAVSVGGNFAMGSGAVVSLGSITTHSAGTLSFNGVGQNSGSWGGSASTATNKNSTYFGTIATGRLNVTTPTCTAGYWTGATSTDWNTNTNWCGNTVPTASTNVVIPSGTPFSPSISGITASVNNLTINASATLTLVSDSNTVLNISGNFVSNGTFSASGSLSKINFVGGNQTVAGVTYSNLNLSGSGTKTFGGTVTVSNLLAISNGVVANLGSNIHPAGILTLGGAGPLSNTWGSTSSNPVATNTNNDFFAATTGKININGSIPYPAIDNNYAWYVNGNSGDIAGTSGEYGNAAHTIPGSVTLSAPIGSAFINVKFASYGLPGGTSPNFTIGSCHAFNSRAVTTGLLGSNVATVPPGGAAFNATFGDPCQNVVKSYNVVATYAQPFCTTGGVPEIVINGSIPNGGKGTYTYLWEKSTSSDPTTGYTAASGINDDINYTVPANTITGTTYYRRTVTSGIYSDATIVIIQVVTGPPTQPTAASFTSTTSCAGTTTLSVSNNGSLGGLGGYVEFYSDSCGGTVVGTSNTIPASVVVSPTTGNLTYYVRYRNSCDMTAACKSTTVTNTLMSISAAASTTDLCYSTTAQEAQLNYSATIGSPNRYSIVWNAAALAAGLVNQTDATFAFAAGGGVLDKIAVPANVPGGTYTGTLTVKNAGSGCVSFKNNFTLLIKPTPTVVISGTTTVCLNSGSPNITFTNPQSLPINVTYKINSGGNNTVAVPANGSFTVAAPTSVAGVFVYNLVSAVYQSSIPTCSSTLTGSATITVNSTPTITLSKTDETCASSNNGTITPSISGGLANIRSIRLTQKYVNATAWQQVAEIQAFEIFTGTNVALASNGATATSSSTYSNNTATYGPQNVIDGNTNNIWHSNSPNINEYIKVDLASAKNLDYLRIYNRADCCQERGQNMLLELLDASNNVVYSKTIDLFENVYTAGHYVDINVLDVSWSDSGTTLNRTGLDAASYTLSYADGAGCSTSSQATIGTTNPNASIASVTGANSICISGTTTYTANTIVLGGGTGAWSSSAPTIATVNASGLVTGVSAGNADIIYTITGGCGASPVSQQKTITVNPNASIASVSGANSVCTSGTTTYTANTIVLGGGTGAWSSSAPAIATVDAAGLVTGVSAGTANIVYTISGGCGASTVSQQKTITVNALPLKPTVNTTQPTCAIPTGTITITNTILGATYSIDGSTYTNTNGIFSGLPENTHYDVTIKSSSGCISPITGVDITDKSLGKTWTGATDSDWSTDSNWSPSGMPGNGDCIIIPDTRLINKPVINSDITAYSFIVEDYGLLTVNSDKVLTVSKGIIVGPNGSFVFENNSSLIQSDANASNVGNITYKRNSMPMRRYDYTRWSSPVTKSPGFTLHDLSPDTLGDKYWSYTPGSGWTPSYGGGQIMEKGIGYNVRAPQTFPLTTWDTHIVSFVGTPNNGDITVTTVVGEWNLVGNPYPSALDANKLINDNSALGTTVGAIYLWTHNSSPVDSDGDGIYTYTTNDYAIYSLSGGLAVKQRSISGGMNITPPDGKIAAGQGFFVLGAGNIKFTNDMRLGAGNNQFFKTSNTSEIEKNRIWLNLTNAKGAFKQLLVGYIEGATNSWDTNYDAATMNSNSYVDFYSINESDNLSIQGRAVPFANTDEVPLGYVTTIAGDFTISIDHVDGLFTEQEIYLEDKVTGKEIDLRAGNYTFTTAIGTFTDRFVLRYTSKTLGTGDFENLENGIFVSVKDKVIKVQSSKEPIKEVTIFDISGKLLYTKKKVSSTELQIPNLNASNEVLLVKVTLENGFSTAKKVIFQ